MHLVNEIPAPDGLTCVGAGRHVQALFQFFTALLRVAAALDAEIDAPDQLRQDAVIAARRQHIQGVGDARGILQAGIGLFQHCLHGPFPQEGRLLLVADAEIRRQLQKIGVFP